MSYTGTFPLGHYEAYKDLFSRSLGRGGASRVNPTYVGSIITTYAIDCYIDGQYNGSYVGSTEDFGYRWSQHLRKLSCGRHANIDLQRLFDKHGAAAFSIRILRTYETTDGLFDHEVMDGLEFFDLCDLLNRRLGHQWINGHSPYTGEVRNSPPRHRARYASAPIAKRRERVVH